MNTSKKQVFAPEVAVLYEEWASRAGSQKGQYRLTHAKVGVLFDELQRLNELVDSVAGAALRAHETAAPQGHYGHVAGCMCSRCRSARLVEWAKTQKT